VRDAVCRHAVMDDEIRVSVEKWLGLCGKGLWFFLIQLSWFADDSAWGELW
jgi:hypothetical protein